VAEIPASMTIVTTKAPFAAVVTVLRPTPLAALPIAVEFGPRPRCPNHAASHRAKDEYGSLGFGTGSGHLAILAPGAARIPLTVSTVVRTLPPTH